MDYLQATTVLRLQILPPVVFDVSSTEILNTPTPLQFQRDSVEHVNCYSGFDGGVYTSTIGGTPPYYYYWEDETGMPLADSVADITGLGVGVYTGFAVDNNGCIADISATINNLNALIRDTLITINGVNCKGDSTGSIQLSILGGAPPFDYAWSNGSNDLNQDMLPSGIYDLTVTDSDTCVAIFTGYEIEEPDEAIMLESTLDTVRCFGDQTGEIALTITGGVLPYMYEWLYNGEVLATTDTTLLNGLPAGDYQLRLQDANMCIQYFDFEITQPEAALSLLIDIAPPNPPDPGTATAIVDGGTPDYQYLWNTGDTTQSIMIDFGNYSLTVTDANDCVVESIIVISSDVALEAWVQNISLYPNPTNKLLNLNAKFKEPLAPNLKIINADGKIMYQKHLTKGQEQSETFDVNHFPAGVYYLIMYAQGKLLYSAAFLKQ